jgi:hypothetical protein
METAVASTIISSNETVSFKEASRISNFPQRGKRLLPRLS